MEAGVNEIIFIVHEPPEGGYAAEALGQPIFTAADTVEELNEAVRDAVACHFEEEARPKIIRLSSRRSRSSGACRRWIFPNVESTTYKPSSVEFRS